ncbi:MAG: LPXTG cell wall anchor domain-containing protein, partial [Gemella haemolysans]|uniref:LPXTG cell wall anchor domain-containing protein n=1 Tax=Gemella haemolysans TaxID=1379 RepID=UPI003FA0EE8C
VTKPKEDTVRPVAPVTKPKEDTVRPVAPVTKPKEDTVKPTSISKNAETAPKLEVPEFGNIEIKKLLTEMEQIVAQIKDGEENGAEPYYIEGLKEKLADLQEAFNTLNENLPTVTNVPAFDLSNLPQENKINLGSNKINLGITNNSNPNKTISEEKDKTQAKVKHKVKDTFKTDPINKTKLPNTGINSTNTTVLGLGFISLIVLTIRRKFTR